MNSFFSFRFLFFAVCSAWMLVVGGGLFVVGYLMLLRPVASDWVEIYKGVYYFSEDVAGAGVHDKRRVMALRVHLDEPGVQLFVRPLDAEADNQHYYLAYPDLMLRREGLSALISTTPFTSEIDDRDLNLVGSSGRPGVFGGIEGFVGRAVSSTQIVVSDGVFSHIPMQATVLWVGDDNVPHLSVNMAGSAIIDAISQPGRERMRWGIGLEVVHVVNGEMNATFSEDRYRLDGNFRPFIGIDSDRKLLFLIAFEWASTRTMIDYALRLGVKSGGQLDAGNTTWLLVGDSPNAIPPFTGVRGGRPIGAYLGVKARPVSADEG